MPESAAKKDVPILSAVDSAERSDTPLTFIEFMRIVLRSIASLRLTVVLFCFSLGLVFFGTVAQMHKETFTIVDEYFYSWGVWVPFQLFAELGKVFLWLPDDTTIRGAFPFPGGFLLGWALLVNLLAAHLVRFRFTWKRSGILIIHTGLAVLLIQEYITRKYAVEAAMTIVEGERVNFVDVARKVELAFLAPTDPSVEDAAVIPESFLRRGGLIQHDALPVDVEVLEFHTNSIHEPAKPDDRETTALTDPQGRTQQVKFIAVPEETGTGDSKRNNAPLVRVRLKKKGTGDELGTYALSLWSYPNYTLRGTAFAPQTVKIDGTQYTLALRPKRVYKPYAIELEKLDISFYPGTASPKGYASEVLLSDPEVGEQRQVRIWMNHPLRHRGETFYQSQVFGGNGTVLQVVQNPGAILPYVACTMISGGMLVHFGILLIGFLGRRVAA
jgi:hypothetical protein